MQTTTPPTTDRNTTIVDGTEYDSEIFPHWSDAKAWAVDLEHRGWKILEIDLCTTCSVYHARASRKVSVSD